MIAVMAETPTSMGAGSLLALVVIAVLMILTGGRRKK